MATPGVPQPTLLVGAETGSQAVDAVVIRECKVFGSRVPVGVVLSGDVGVGFLSRALESQVFVCV